MSAGTRFVTRPVEPQHVTAVQFNGGNDQDVQDFVAQIGGRLIEWIEPNLWVAFDDGREGFPVEPTDWVVRVDGSDELDIFDAAEFDLRYQPLAPAGDR